MQDKAYSMRRAALLMAAMTGFAFAQTVDPLPDGGTALPDLREHLAACAACHGEHGEGIDSGAEFYPHLAGKPAGYLLSQMQAFRDGRRHYPRMVYLMQYMDDRYLGEIAQWYAAQPAQTRRAHAGASALDTIAVQRAEQLVFHGDPARGLPACATCHGADLAGVEPGIPALVGLPPDYIVAQLGGWVMGARKGEAPDCMAKVAQIIDPRDVRLLATWLSEQAAEADARPAPADSIALPMPCGTQPQTAARAPAGPADAPALDANDGGDPDAEGHAAIDGVSP